LQSISPCGILKVVYQSNLEIGMQNKFNDLIAMVFLGCRGTCNAVRTQIILLSDTQETDIPT
jgi:hypothetical protein